jgi:hypothetical protein
MNSYRINSSREETFSLTFSLVSTSANRPFPGSTPATLLIAPVGFLWASSWAYAWKRVLGVARSAYSPTLITEAVRFSEISVNFYQTTRRHIQDASTLHSHAMKTSNPATQYMFIMWNARNPKIECMGKVQSIFQRSDIVTPVFQGSWVLRHQPGDTRTCECRRNNVRNVTMRQLLWQLCTVCTICTRLQALELKQRKWTAT